jgi:hypothetical protein
MPNSPFDDVLSSITVENDNAAAAAASQPQPAENITAGSPIPEAAGNKPIASEDSKLPKALQPVKPADVKKVVEDPSKAATPPKDKSSLSEIEKATIHSESSCPKGMKNMPKKFACLSNL